MLLRRVIEHFRKQEWTAIAIDFAIVVIGVFVGMQVNNWNEARRTNLLAADYEERLAADLSLEALNFHTFVRYYEDVRKAATNAHAALVGKFELSDTDLLADMFRASQYSWADRHRATFDELVASGNLDLIDDPERRSLMSSYYALDLLEQISSESQNSEYRRAFRMIVSPEMQDALNERCGDRQIEGAPPGFVTLDYQCELDWPQDEIAEAAARLRSDPSLLPLLRLRIANLGSRIFTLRQQSEIYRPILPKPEGGA